MTWRLLDQGHVSEMLQLMLGNTDMGNIDPSGDISCATSASICQGLVMIGEIPRATNDLKYFFLYGTLGWRNGTALWNLFGHSMPAFQKEAGIKESR